MLRIAFLGSRGIPACYGGFETFYEQISWRLAERGHQVTVYNRSQYIDYREPTFRRVRLVRLPTIRTKHLDTITHTLLSTIHALFERYDIVYICTVGNSPLSFIPKLSGAKTVLNVDGADWQREKWSPLAKAYIKFCERIATILPDMVVTDSRAAQLRYRQMYGKETVFIPYGAEARERQVLPPRFEDPDVGVLSEFGLEKDRYILFVSRLEPENGAHVLIQAFKGISTDMKLVIVGDSPYGDRYKRRLRSIAAPNVIFTGYLFGQRYQALSSNAYLFVLPSAVEGTRPVLLEQMGFGNCVLAMDCPTSREVIADAGIIFSRDDPVTDLKDKIARLLEHPEEVMRYRQKATKRIRENYSWEKIADEYERLFHRLAAKL